MHQFCSHVRKYATQLLISDFNFSICEYLIITSLITRLAISRSDSDVSLKAIKQVSNKNCYCYLIVVKMIKTLQRFWLEKKRGLVEKNLTVEKTGLAKCCFFGLRKFLIFKISPTHNLKTGKIYLSFGNDKTKRNFASLSHFYRNLSKKVVIVFLTTNLKKINFSNQILKENFPQKYLFSFFADISAFRFFFSLFFKICN